MAKINWTRAYREFLVRHQESLAHDRLARLADFENRLDRHHRYTLTRQRCDDDMLERMIEDILVAPAFPPQDGSGHEKRYGEFFKPDERRSLSLIAQRTRDRHR